MRRRSDRGFTLIEMLLAITIFGLLMIGVYQSFDQAFRSYQTVQRTRDVFDTARGAMDLIHEDLSSAVIFSGQPSAVFIGRDDSDGREANLDSVVMFTLTHTPLQPGAAAADQCEVEYRIITDRETGKRALLRREEPNPDALHEEGGGYTVLTDRVVSLDFRYFDGELWTEFWDSASRGDAAAAEARVDRDDTRNRGVLPEAVETELIIADDEGREEVFTMATRIMLGGVRPVEEEPTGSAEEGEANEGEESSGNDDGDEDDDGSVS